jgi:hypothetical protein
MSPRKKVYADSIWNYEELPPARLVKSLHLEEATTNSEEFSRAEWFWGRRPKVLCENLVFLFCYIIIFVCLLYLVPESFLSLLVWMVTAAGCVFIDCHRLHRWRTEYESSIKRLIASLSQRR